MSFRFLPLLALIVACGWSEPSHAHGTERPFGTQINGRRSTPATAASRGAPAFTLLALSANLSALERDIGAGKQSEVRARAQHLPGMARDLVARSRHLSAPEREQFDLAARFITESAERIDSAAAGLETEGVLREVTLVRGQIATLKDLLRDADD